MREVVDDHVDDPRFAAPVCLREGAAQLSGLLDPHAVEAETLGDLTKDRTRVMNMAKAARSLARPDATERVVNYCLEAANG